MDYKQKYKEAIERARKLKENPKAIFFEEKNVHVSDYIFPELKESEDERIIKNIISWLKNIDGQTIPINDYNAAIAWLEKQKDTLKDTLKDIEQNPAWSEEDENGLGDTLWAIKQARTIAKDENDMGNLWYAESWVKSLKDRVQPQTKQEWKQENTGDLTDFENAMMHIGNSFFGENAGLDPNDTNVIKEQANLLSELVPKQEWSEEDEDKMILIEDRFSDYLDYVREDNSLTKYQKNSTKDEIVNLSIWLKSLRPRNTWKPSDEQIKALEGCVDYLNESDNEDLLVMESLLEQLKAL